MRYCLLPRHSRLPADLGGQGGQALAWALVFLAVASLVVTPLLLFAGTSLRARDRAQELDGQRWAAEAAVRRVMADLAMGADALPATYDTYSPHKPGKPYTTYQIATSYTVPTVAANGYTAAVSIASPQAGVALAGTQQYIDPGVANSKLSSVAKGKGYLMRLFNVRAGTLIVNWAFSPAGRTRIAVWDGLPVDPATGAPYAPGEIPSFPLETPVADSHWSNTNATSVRTPALNTLEGKVYSVVFFVYGDQTGGPRNARPFVGAGGVDETWVYLLAYRDYLIAATAGDVTAQAYVRQVPGFSQPPATAWSPSGVAWVPNRAFIRSWALP